MDGFVKIGGTALGPSNKVVLTDQADSDLENVGGLTRRFLTRTLQDELLSPNQGTAVAKVQVGEGEGDWYTVEVGNYSALFRTQAEGAGGAVRLIERVVPSEEMKPELIETATQSSPDTEDSPSAPPAEAGGLT